LIVSEKVSVNYTGAVE